MNDDDDAFVPYWEQPKKKQLRFNFLTNTPENVIRATAHQAVHFDPTQYNAVWTCPNCGIWLAYEDKAGVFHLTKYVYLSESGNLHSNERALQLDHDPPWAGRLKAHKKNKSTYEEQRADYQDESQLRALCRVCNGNHQLENRGVTDYDSDDDGGPPSTPKHEVQYNQGAWSGWRV